MLRFVVAVAVMAAGVLPAAATESNDQRVANLLAKSLESSDVLKGFKIKVQFREGTARLQGFVRNKQQLDEAMAIANRTPQVEQVINQLEIKVETPAAPPALATPALRQASTSPPKAQRLPQPAERLPQPAPEAEPQPLTTASQDRPILRSTPRPARPAQEPQRVEMSRLVSREPQPAAPPMMEQVIEDRPVSRPTTSALKPTPQHAARRPAAHNRSVLADVHAAEQFGWGRSAPQTPAGNRQASAQMTPRRPRSQPMPIGYARGQVPQQGYAMGQMPPAYAMGQMAPAYYQQPMQPQVPVPAYAPGAGGGQAPALYDQPYMPNYAWPSYAAYPNYAALTYPKQYSPTAWPYIGPFYPYPQVPLGWRKVTLEWDDGWWFLDFSDDRRHGGGR